MPYKTYLMFGYPATLVLTDTRGEFEIRDAFEGNKPDGFPVMAINWERIQEAVDKRAAEGIVTRTRPVY